MREGASMTTRPCLSSTSSGGAVRGEGQRHGRYFFQPFPTLALLAMSRGSGSALLILFVFICLPSPARRVVCHSRVGVSSSRALCEKSWPITVRPAYAKLALH